MMEGLVRLLVEVTAVTVLVGASAMLYYLLLPSPLLMRKGGVEDGAAVCLVCVLVYGAMRGGLEGFYTIKKAVTAKSHALGTLVIAAPVIFLAVMLYTSPALQTSLSSVLQELLGSPLYTLCVSTITDQKKHLPLLGRLTVLLAVISLCFHVVMIPVFFLAKATLTLWRRLSSPKQAT